MSESRSGICSDRDTDPFLVWKPNFTLSERKALSNQAFETQKGGILDGDLLICLESHNSEDLWMQSSFGTWFVRVNLGNARWSHAWVNQRSRNKNTSQSADPVRDRDGGCKLAMLVNAHSSNHKPNQEVDCDQKLLKECDSLLCEQAHRHITFVWFHLQLNSSKKVLQFKFDWSYLSYYHIFFIIIGIIKKLVELE